MVPVAGRCGSVWSWGAAWACGWGCGSRRGRRSRVTCASASVGRRCGERRLCGTRIPAPCRGRGPARRERAGVRAPGRLRRSRSGFGARVPGCTRTLASTLGPRGLWPSYVMLCASVWAPRGGPGGWRAWCWRWMACSRRCRAAATRRHTISSRGPRGLPWRLLTRPRLRTRSGRTWMMSLPRLCLILRGQGARRLSARGWSRLWSRLSRWCIGGRRIWFEFGSGLTVANWTAGGIRSDFAASCAWWCARGVRWQMGAARGRCASLCLLGCWLKRAGTRRGWTRMPCLRHIALCSHAGMSRRRTA